MLEEWKKLSSEKQKAKWLSRTLKRNCIEIVVGHGADEKVISGLGVAIDSLVRSTRKQAEVRFPSLGVVLRPGSKRITYYNVIFKAMERLTKPVSKEELLFKQLHSSITLGDVARTYFSNKKYVQIFLVDEWAYIGSKTNLEKDDTVEIEVIKEKLAEKMVKLYDGFHLRQSQTCYNKTFEQSMKDSGVSASLMAKITKFVEGFRDVA